MPRCRRPRPPWYWPWPFGPFQVGRELIAHGQPDVAALERGIAWAEEMVDATADRVSYALLWSSVAEQLRGAAALLEIQRAIP